MRLAWLHGKSARRRNGLWVLECALLWACAGLPIGAQSGASGAISPAEYRARVQSLDRLLAACEQSAANCKSDQVGPDLQVQAPEGSRKVRFGWLRSLLDAAANPVVAKAQTKPENPSEKKATAVVPDFPQPSLAERLADARRRLGEEAETPDAASGSPPVASGDAHRTLTSILAASEYKAAVVGPSIKDRILEKTANWLNKIFSAIARAGAKSKWIGITAEVGFVALLCGALIWFLIRLERQSRFNLASFNTGPSAGAASARDWQLWLEDARRAASQGAWRDAIHLTYWASISRLESSGMWPADRARTPREYLALLGPESSQRSGLVALTRSLERTWYGNRPAGESDFRQAEQLAAELGAGRGSRMGGK